MEQLVNGDLSLETIFGLINKHEKIVIPLKNSRQAFWEIVQLYLSHPIISSRPDKHFIEILLNSTKKRVISMIKNPESAGIQDYISEINKNLAGFSERISKELDRISAKFKSILNTKGDFIKILGRLNAALFLEGEARKSIIQDF
jgi:hypothetical protein